MGISISFKVLFKQLLRFFNILQNRCTLVPPPIQPYPLYQTFVAKNSQTINVLKTLILINSYTLNYLTFGKDRSPP